MPNQEHVCIAITKSNMGGAQKYVLMLATELKNRGKKVTVLAGGDGELFENLSKAGVECVRLGNSQRDISLVKEVRLANELYRLLSDIRPDVLHLNSSKLGVLGTIVGKLAGIRTIVFTAHGWAFNENRPGWQKLAFYFLYWITIGMCDMTICVSHKTREQILALPFVKNKTTVIYNGITSPDFYMRDEARRQLADQFSFLDRNKKWIAVLAELHPIKGHDILIDAVSDIRDRLSEYQIVCLGAGEREPELRNMVIENKVEEYVYFTGFVDSASRYLQAFEMSILSSRSEAMPLAVLESGLAGTLVLASRVGGIPEVIDDGVTGFLFEKENHTELAKKILTAIELEPEAKKNMCDALMKKISESFSVSQMVEKTESVYRNTKR
jgi:glycosyltransferase involved in cell wall biosynthesis